VAETQCQHLGETYDWFTEGFDTGELTTARTLLNAMSGGQWRESMRDSSILRP